MTEAEFVRNHRGIDQGKDLPKDMLEGMYRRVKVGGNKRGGRETEVFSRFEIFVPLLRASAPAYKQN